ncbi:conserved hypothetical protein [Ricinus communis]|uniref:Small ribosomal subunit protein mS38 n=1 Tax=Ricinus communis TaxID=3988 RepID=B9SLT9_RICCO|nr:conserved hypothetical protein [Ricinus communis]
MAALSTLQKIFKQSPSPSRILASLHNPYLLHSQNPSQTHQHVNITPNNDNQTTKLSPFFGSCKDGSFTHFDSLPFLSIHPLGLCSNPILATGSIQDLQNNNDENDSGMWADSVKKKRKKKMNKHKYKKLRKRLRKQT